MEQWQIEALQALLETETKEVEAGQRVYVSSQEYGNSRYHLLERVYDGVQVEQMETGEKWNKRVNLYTDEIPATLKTLLTWYLEDVRQRQEQQQAAAATPDEGLGDLDDHPF
jgi:hypothetical protein